MAVFLGEFPISHLTRSSLPSSTSYLLPSLFFSPSRLTLLWDDSKGHSIFSRRGYHYLTFFDGWHERVKESQHLYCPLALLTSSKRMTTPTLYQAMHELEEHSHNILCITHPFNYHGDADLHDYSIVSPPEARAQSGHYRFTLESDAQSLHQNDKNFQRKAPSSRPSYLWHVFAAKVQGERLRTYYLRPRLLCRNLEKCLTPTTHTGCCSTLSNLHTRGKAVTLCTGALIVLILSPQSSYTHPRANALTGASSPDICGATQGLTCCALFLNVTLSEPRTELTWLALSKS